MRNDCRHLANQTTRLGLSHVEYGSLHQSVSCLPGIYISASFNVSQFLFISILATIEVLTPLIVSLDNKIASSGCAERN